MASGVVIDAPAAATPSGADTPSGRHAPTTVAGWEARSPWATLALGQGVLGGGVDHPHTPHLAT